MSRQPDTSRPLDLDALNKPSGPHTYEVSPGNSVLRFLRDVKAAARTVAAVACLGFAACATTASGKAAVAPTAPPAAAVPPVPGGPAPAPPPGPPPPPAAGHAAAPVVPYIPSGAMPGTPGVSLFRPVPDDGRFVEWRGADSTNTLRVQIDHSRRRLFLATTPGAPFALHGGCPPYWDVEMAGLPAGTSPDDAVLNPTVTGRMPDRGTFDVTGQASTREGQVVTAGFDCVGRDGTGAEVDRERLTATVASMGGVQGRGSASGSPAAPFPFRGNAPHGGGSDEESSGGPVFAEAALAVARPISNGSDNNPALDIDVGVDPVNGSDWNEHAQLGGRFRAARAFEKVDTVNDAGKTVATGGEITGNTFCGFLRGAWAPEIARRVRAVLGGGPGVCHAQAIKTGPNSDIPGVTGVAGEVDAGIQVGGQNFGGKAGWEATFGGQDAFQTHGPFVGLYGRF